MALLARYSHMVHLSHDIIFFPTSPRDLPRLRREKSVLIKPSLAAVLPPEALYPLFHKPRHHEKSGHRVSPPRYGNACPNPAARSVASSGPRPAQHSASAPSITTAGTERMPKLFARRATSGLCISRIVTSQEGHATCFTNATVSSQTTHPALKTSTTRLLSTV